jgi:TonB family protein
MALRCLLFTSEAGTAEPICQALSALGVDGEHCPEPVGAIDKVTQQTFQIVIIDWDQQPEAAMVLAACRERKASERPLTLAIVSEDINVPKALQAGANSILRRPIVINQVKDTLTTARDLLKAKESAAQAAAAGATAHPAPANSVLSSLPPSIAAGDENRKNLRAGEFLPSSGPKPSGEFVVEETSASDFAEPVPGTVDPLKELEPMAASVAKASVAQVKPPAPSSQSVAPSLPPVPPPSPGDEPRGLDWYLKRAGLGQSAAAPAPAREDAPLASSKPELLGFDQTPSHSATAPSIQAASGAEEPPSVPERSVAHEKKAEDRLFAYIDGGSSETAEANPRFRFGKKAIVAASLLAVCAIIAAPQAPWHGSVAAQWARGQRSLRAWLNPQVVTTTSQAPESHESFARAGDEYKLPVAETIPDATTDPSQIKVVPVIDPTAKKPNNSATPDQSAQPADGTDQTTDPATQGTASPAPTDQSVGTSPDGVQPANDPSAAPPTSPVSPQPAGAQPAASTSAPTSSAATPNIAGASTSAAQPHSNSPAVPSSLLTPRPADPAGPVVQVPQAGPNASVAGPSNVPSSLKSQIASMTPDASGNKPPEAAMPSIEPVVVPEAAERQLAATQLSIAYPASAKGQQGTVTLQVLIGRDGSVQDAKFLQGSLAFARAAIDGVKQWKFKPYTLNGRPVSVQTTLTMSFEPSN